MKTYLTLVLLVCGGHFAGMASANEIDSLCKVTCVRIRINDVVRGNESQRQYELNCEFYQACIDNNLALAKKLLKRGADINMKIRYDSGFDNTVLTVATWEMCDLAIVKFLVENGSDINYVNEAGFTALSHAERKGKKDIVDYLKRCGAKSKEELSKPDSRSNRRDRNNSQQSFGVVRGNESQRQYELNCEFYQACTNNNLALAKELLKRGADINMKVRYCDLDNTVLTIVTWGTCDLEMVKFLVENGSDVNFVNGAGSTALSHAEFKGKKEVVAYLKNCGAKGKEELPEPDSRSNRRDRNNRKQSESPKQSNQNLKESKTDDPHFGFGKEKKEISEEERKRQEKLLKQRRRLARLPPTHLNLKNQDMRQVHQFLAAVACGDLKKAEEFLTTGVSIHATNIAGKSALHIAARGGDTKVLEFLIEKGIAADYQDINGNTALHEALLVGQKEAASYLIEVGVALNIVNNPGQYVLQLAIQKGCEDIVKLLIKNKVDLNVLTNKEEPMLFLALEKKQLAIAKLLLDAGVDISLTSEKGETIFEFLDRKKKEDPSSSVYSEFLTIMTKDDK